MNNEDGFTGRMRLQSLSRRHEVAARTLRQKADDLDDALYEFQHSWGKMLGSVEQLAHRLGVMGDPIATRELCEAREQFEQRVARARREL